MARGQGVCVDSRGRGVCFLCDGESADYGGYDEDDEGEDGRHYR